MGIENGDGIISCRGCWRREGYGEGPYCNDCKNSALVNKATSELKVENKRLRKENARLKRKTKQKT